MINATVVGQYFLSKNQDLTDIQIQKLVYYAYSWYMVKNNREKLFEERPQAWIHGPVFRTLFDNMKNTEKFINDETYKEMEKEKKNFLDIIYSIYGRLSGNDLEKMTHSETPWIKARNGLASYEFSQNLISDEDIIECYGR